MPRERKIQIRLREQDDLNIKTAMKIFRTSSKSDALRKSLGLAAILENFFQTDGSLKILDEKGDEKILLFF